MKQLRTTLSLAGALLAAGVWIAFSSASAEPISEDRELEILGVFEGQVLGEDELGIYRGGAEVVQESDLDAEVNDNVVGDNVTTGSITFNDSFTQNSGIHSSLVNSGNNVSMQSSMTVNVYID